jgi:hypothetical protein
MTATKIMGILNYQIFLHVFMQIFSFILFVSYSATLFTHFEHGWQKASLDCAQGESGSLC